MHTYSILFYRYVNSIVFASINSKELLDDKSKMPPERCNEKTSAYLQCCSIENHQSPFYVVNRVTLTGKKLH